MHYLSEWFVELGLATAELNFTLATSANWVNVVTDDLIVLLAELLVLVRAA